MAMTRPDVHLHTFYRTHSMLQRFNLDCALIFSLESMDSETRPNTASELPSDVLREIFSHCLPEFPLEEVQPNPKIAPMQLCHVCTSWRAVALDSPSLWSNLYYRLPIRTKDGKHIAWNAERFRLDMECLRWWRRNQGSRTPSIRFETYQPDEETKSYYEEFPLTAEIENLFVDYLSSARHLDVERFGRYVLQQDTSGIASPLPNLHSLVTTHFVGKENVKKYGGSPPLPQVLIPPSLRRLSLYKVQLKSDLVDTVFSNWSRLTHLSLQSYMMPDVWFSLIRSLPNLQWGFFSIFLDLTDDDYDPPAFTLPFLSTLSVTLDNSEGNGEDEPLLQFLIGLHLPILHDLSIYIDADPQAFADVTAKINEGLEFAPAVTKLTLGFQFFGFYHFGEPPMSEEEWAETTKLPTKAPHLEHLVIDTRYITDFDPEGGSTVLDRAKHWAELLPSHRWLDLANPASAIKKITVVVKTPSTDGPVVEPLFRAALGTEADGIEFEVVEGDKRDLSPDAEGWRMWGPSIY